MEEMARQLAELTTAMQQQQAEIQRLRAEAAAAAAQPAAGGGAPSLEALSAAVGAAVAASLAQQEPRARALIDVRGLGKPPVFKNTEATFQEWSRKLAGFASASYGEAFRAMLEWAEDQEETLTREDLTTAFGPDSLEDEVSNLREKDMQLHVALQNLTEGESYDLVMGAGPGNGVEAFRLLVRRWDPASGGRRRALLRSVLNPPRSSLKDLASSLEKWEALVRRFERRRAHGGPVRPLEEDIKISALEGLVPPELESHLALNASRLPDYAAVRSEVISFVEARRSQGAIGSARPIQRGDPMDVDAFAKGKGKGKGKGKSKGKGRGAGGDPKKRQPECWNCGKTGHYAAECWQKPKHQQQQQQQQQQKQTQQQGKGKGRDKGKGKGKSKHLNELGMEAPQEANPAAAAGSLDTAGPFVLDMCSVWQHARAHAHETEKSDPVDEADTADSAKSADFRSPRNAYSSSVDAGDSVCHACCGAAVHPAPAASDGRCENRDLGGFGLATSELELGALDGWLRFTHDTGAAETAFPGSTPGQRSVPNPLASYKTASGEIIPDEGGLVVSGWSELGGNLRLSGRCAAVHKPLVSASRVHNKGHATWLEKGGGYILPGNGRLMKRIREMIAREISQETGAIPLWEEQGTYVGYVRLAGPAATGEAKTGTRAAALCPVGQEETVFRRQAVRP